MKKKGAFTLYADSWRVIYETLGPEVARPRPVLAKRPRAVGADRWMQHMPVAPPMFTALGRSRSSATRRASAAGAWTRS
jgi:hypothetical protein